MINTAEIKTRMRKLGLKQKDIARELSIAIPTVSQKINNVRPFTLDEAAQLRSLLHLNEREFQRYFFSN